MFGAILGIFLGLFLIYGTPLPVSLAGRRPAHVPGPAGLIITFEMTMLGLMGFSFLGMFVDSGFPSYTPKEYMPEISDGKIAILFSCPADEQEKYAEALKSSALKKSSRRRRVNYEYQSWRHHQTLAMVLIVAAALLGVTMLFTYDVIKLEWPSFMEIQPSYRPMENPLPVPAQSIPIEGPVTIPGMGAPENPMQGG